MCALRIKVCGMRDTGNIQDLVKLSPEYIGLIFYPKSKRYVEDAMAQSILKEIPNSIKKVGVFVNELQDEVISKAHNFKLDLVQIHGNESPQYCKELQGTGLKVVKAFGIDEDFDFDALNKYQDSCDYFLFDTKSPKHGGTGIKFNWEILKQYDNSKPVFLSGGISPDDALEIKKIDWLNIHAIDINSRFEIEPALKNIDLLTKFFNEIR